MYPGLMGLLGTIAVSMIPPEKLGRGYGPRNTPPNLWRTIHPLNRSQHWRRFDSYKAAREFAISKGYSNHRVW